MASISSTRRCTYGTVSVYFSVSVFMSYKYGRLLMKRITTVCTRFLLYRPLPSLCTIHCTPNPTLLRFSHTYGRWIRSLILIVSLRVGVCTAVRCYLVARSGLLSTLSLGSGINKQIDRGFILSPPRNLSSYIE